MRDAVGFEQDYRYLLHDRGRFGPDFWTPAPLLEELVRAGKGFYSRSATAPTIHR